MSTTLFQRPTAPEILAKPDQKLPLERQKSLEEAAQVAPPSTILSVVSNPFYENRILTIRLFALTSSEATRRKIYQPIALVSLEAGYLGKTEVNRIGDIVGDLNTQAQSSPSALSDRLLQISSMKESGLVSGRRKIYDPEWDRTWEFPESDPLTPRNVSTALRDFLAKPKPSPPPIN